MDGLIAGGSKRGCEVIAGGSVGERVGEEVEGSQGLSTDGGVPSVDMRCSAEERVGRLGKLMPGIVLCRGEHTSLIVCK